MSMAYTKVLDTEIFIMELLEFSKKMKKGGLQLLNSSMGFEEFEIMIDGNCNAVVFVS